MKDFCIVGSGIAGSTIANLLSKKYSVEILDKARGPGGRSSNRRYKSKLSFDHGLQYFSPKSHQFKKFIIDLKKKNILKVWQGNHLDFTFKKKEKLSKYIGKKGNNDISKYLIKNIPVKYNSTVTNIKFNSKYWIITINNNKKVFFKNLILTCPFPQLKKLASKYLKKNKLNFKINMLPNITVMAAYNHYSKLAISSIKFDDEIVAWAANENSKNRFKTSQSLWTIQCTQTFSKKFINLFKKDKNKYQSIVLKKFESLLGYQTKKIASKNIHGWKYSFNKSKTTFESFWDNRNQFGICGDWLIGPKAENAWQSARNLFQQIKKKPS
jgi:renalase